MMDEKTKETVKEVAEYENDSKKRTARGTCICFSLGFVLLGIYVVMKQLDVPVSPFTDFVSGFVLGFSMVTMVIGIVFSAGKYVKFANVKKTSKK